MEELNQLLEKYDNFKYAQLRSIEALTESSKLLTIMIQDDDGEDVESIGIVFTDIKQEKILVNSVLSYLDMGFGISIIKEHDLYGFAVGSGTSMIHVHSAPMYIVASDIKIQA